MLAAMSVTDIHVFMKNAKLYFLNLEKDYSGSSHVPFSYSVRLVQFQMQGCLCPFKTIWAQQILARAIGNWGVTIHFSEIILQQLSILKKI